MCTLISGQKNVINKSDDKSLDLQPRARDVVFVKFNRFQIRTENLDYHGH